MHDFEVVVILMGLAVGLAILARYLELAYPILLVVGGLLISLVPGAPRYSLPPEVVFLAFLPPLLYAAAFNTHWPSFRKELRAITLLAVGLVLFTMTGVAWVAHDFVGLAWGPAFVLGAIVSPPDAVAALAVTKRVRIPRRVATVLEGESLVNDASTLVAYRLAIVAVSTGTFSWGEAAADFLAVSLGGIAVGLVGGFLAVRLHGQFDGSKLTDSKIDIAMTLLTPYALYLPAEHLGVSGVLSVVTAGLYVGTRQHRVFHRDLRLEARPVWEMMEFLLNGLIFILIGFQLPQILAQLDAAKYPNAMLVQSAAAIAAAVIVTRLLWMYPGAYLPRYFDRHVLKEKVVMPSPRAVAVVAWTGMRGVVSLAAALAVPQTKTNGEPFPDRDLIQFLTFWSIFATLVGQGLTLPFIIRRLRVDRLAEQEERKLKSAKTSVEVPLT